MPSTDQMLVRSITSSKHIQPEAKIQKYSTKHESEMPQIMLMDMDDQQQEKRVHKMFNSKKTVVEKRKIYDGSNTSSSNYLAPTFKHQSTHIPVSNFNRPKIQKGG